MTEPNEATPTVSALSTPVGDDTSLKSLVFHSLLVGMTPFIPVPFLDDWARSLIMRRLYRRLLADYGFENSRQPAAILYDEPMTVTGCLWLLITLPWFLFKKTVIWAITKILKLLIFVLIIDECSNLMSEAFHKGYLVLYLLRKGTLTPDDSSDELLSQLRVKIEGTCAHLDTKILRKNLKQVFVDSPALVKQAGRALKSIVSSLKTTATDQSLPEELEENNSSGAFQKLTERILEILKGMPDYLASIEAAYEEHDSVL